jgi:hypothetical protein
MHINRHKLHNTKELKYYKETPEEKKRFVPPKKRYNRSKMKKVVIYEEDLEV